MLNHNRRRNRSTVSPTFSKRFQSLPDGLFLAISEPFGRSPQFYCRLMAQE